MHFISHSEHLGLIFGNKQTSFLCFVMKNSMALSLENSLRKHDAVEAVSMSYSKGEAVSPQAWV